MVVPHLILIPLFDIVQAELRPRNGDARKVQALPGPGRCPTQGLTGGRNLARSPTPPQAEKVVRIRLRGERREAKAEILARSTIVTEYLTSVKKR